MNEKEEEILANCGALSYSVSRVAFLFGWNEEETKKELSNPLSPKYKIYQAGVIRGEYEIDAKLFELAKSGDLKALELHEKNKQKRKLSNG